LESLRPEGVAEVSPIKFGSTGVKGVSEALLADLGAVATDRLQANLALATPVDLELMDRATKVATPLVSNRVVAVAVPVKRVNPRRRAGQVEMAFLIRLLVLRSNIQSVVRLALAPIPGPLRLLQVPAEAAREMGVTTARPAVMEL